MSNAAAPSRDSHRELEALVQQYGSLIRRVVARVAGSRLAGSHDDIVQQVLVNLWRQLEREQTIEYPASYVYRAAVREAARALRQVVRQPVRSLDEPDGDFDPPDAAPTPEQSLASLRKVEQIGEAVASLRPDRQKAVRAYLAGFSVTEIMEMQGWPYQKARNLIARGIADLRARLSPEDGRG